jgi:hypothetical protein
MPLIALGTAEIMAIIAAEEAAALAAATAVSEAAIAEAAITEAATQEAAKQTAAEAAKQAAAESAKQGIMQAGAATDVNAGVSQGIVGATPPAGMPPPPATPLPPAGATPAGPLPPAGLAQVTDPMVQEMQRLMAEEALKTASTDAGTQYANVVDKLNPPSLTGESRIITDVPASSGNTISSAASNTPANIPEAPYRPLFEAPQSPYLAETTPEYINTAAKSMESVPTTNPFMQAFSEAGKFAKESPFITGAGIYGTLAATGSLDQKGAAPPEQRKFNNPYTFSPNFKGTHPNPNDYQYTPRYPSYAMGGITGASPQTNFANPSAYEQGTSQYSVATDPYSGNIAQRMADGGVTGSGQMQLNVPLSVGGAGGGGGSLGGGGGYGGYDGTGGPGLGPDVNNFGGGGGYAPPGGPQVGAPYQDHPLRPLIGTTQQKIQAANERAANQNMGPMYNSTNSTTSADMGYPMQQQPMQRGIGGKGSMTGPQYAQGGIASYKRGGDTDIYDASLRFANMLDNPNRYTPPDTRFQSVDTFRDTNPNTSTKSPEEAAEIRRKAIEQRSYVNTGAKFPTASRRPGQLDLGPVGGERGKYDNQESILAAQGGIMGYNLGGYASGGNPRLLRGPGDGMSDNIPATIANRQPARLADGEFVVPADVVSHLGNGSTEAGAKILHQMMDKVRVARTGNPKQGKKINPNKFMPKK